MVLQRRHFSSTPPGTRLARSEPQSQRNPQVCANAGAEFEPTTSVIDFIMSSPIQTDKGTMTQKKLIVNIT